MLADGISCGLHRIERLMRRQALRACPRRRGLPNDIGERLVIAANILDRQFAAESPNQKWVADFTYIWTAEGGTKATFLSGIRRQGQGQNPTPRYSLTDLAPRR